MGGWRRLKGGGGIDVVAVRWGTRSHFRAFSPIRNDKVFQWLEVANVTNVHFSSSRLADYFYVKG